MAIDLDALLTALETDPAARARIRQAVLAQDLLDLPALVERGFLQVTGKIGQLAARMGELTERVDRLTAWMESANGRLGHLLGDNYEREAVARSAPVEQAVGASFGTVRPVSEQEVVAQLRPAVRAGQLDAERAYDVRRANGIFLWEEPGQPPVYCVVEASVTAHADDVDRATARAEAVAASGAAARPVVLSAEVAPEAEAAIKAGRVAWARVPVKRRHRPPGL